MPQKQTNEKPKPNHTHPVPPRKAPNNLEKQKSCKMRKDHYNHLKSAGCIIHMKIMHGSAIDKKISDGNTS